MNRPSTGFAFIYGLVYLSACVSAANVVAYTVTRTLPDNGQPSVRSLLRRATVGETLTNNASLGGYYASVQVGTPAQMLTLLLGTGSSDVWVIDKLASSCLNTMCLTPFNPNISQTISTVTAGGFKISYADGTYANGDYIKDEFAVGPGGQARMVLQMGLATNISSEEVTGGGIMGIGYDGDEATLVRYPSFMDQMVNNQLINTKLYSLWLNDIGSSTGSILFGGIDTEKYYGTLYSMPIHKDSQGDYTSFIVGLTSLRIMAQNGSTILITNSSFSAPVVLESSTTEIYLPNDLVNTIYEMFNVVLSGGNPYVDCKYSNSSYMSFGFESGSVINVAYSEFVNKLFLPSPLPTNLPFSDVCLMGILNGDSDFILGDFFLRSAYIVYDLTNNRIGIAQSNLNSTASNVVEVPAGAVSIPQSTGVALSSPTITSTSPTSSSSNAATSISSNTPTNTSSPNNNHAVATGVGVAVPVVAILAVLAGFFIWRRRGRASPPATVVQPFNPPYPAEAAGSEVKYNPSSNSHIHSNSLALEPVSPTSHNISELSSPHNSIPPGLPPRDTRSTFQRKPVPAPVPQNLGGEFFVQSYDGEGGNRPLSDEGLDDYREEQRPMSSVITGPLEDMPVR